MKQVGQDRQGPGQAPASHDVRARPPQPTNATAPGQLGPVAEAS